MNLFAGSEIVLVEFIYLFIIIFGLVTVLDYPMLENQLNQVQTFVSGWILESVFVFSIQMIKNKKTENSVFFHQPNGAFFIFYFSFVLKSFELLKLSYPFLVFWAIFALDVELPYIPLRFCNCCLFWISLEILYSQFLFFCWILAVFFLKFIIEEVLIMV